MKRLALFLVCLVSWDCVDDLCAVALGASEREIICFSSDDDFYPFSLVEAAAIRNNICADHFVPAHDLVMAYLMPSTDGLCFQMSLQL
jgi:hypothetical protein